MLRSLHLSRSDRFPALPRVWPDRAAHAPLALDVKPLPEGAPEGYQGAVGSFTISAIADTGVGKIDDPIAIPLRS